MSPPPSVGVSVLNLHTSLCLSSYLKAAKERMTQQGLDNVFDVSFLTSRGVWTHILLGVYLHE